MRDLLILNERDIRHPNAGGAEVNLFEVGRRLAARGYRVSVLCTRFANSRPDETIDGIRVVRFGNRLTYYLQLATQVRRRLRPDTVIVEHLCKLPFCAPLYTSAPVLPIVHHLFGRTAFWQVPFLVAMVVCAAEWLIPPMYRRCRFIAVSPSTRDDLVSRGIADARIWIVPNGVDCDLYRPPSVLPDDQPTLLVFGRVEPYKRVDLVLRVFERVRSQIPEARLLIVGGGTGLDAVRAEVARLQLEDSVECTGPVAEADKVRLLQSAHVALNASEKEGWGLTVVEAGACGVPTIASDVPGLRDAVVDGRTGVLVAHGDVEAMASAAIHLLRDRTARRQLGRGAREWAEGFSWDGVATATAQCIEIICGAADVEAPLDWFAAGRNSLRTQRAS